jgi:hypothetical protein
MKNLLVALVCLLGFKAVSAQDIIKLEIDSTTFSNKVIVPNLHNMAKLFKASQKDFAVTMLSLDYKLSKIDSSEVYVPKTGDIIPALGVMKDEELVSVMFYQTTTYLKQMKESFLSQYSNVVHKRIKGTDAYYFKMDDDKVYCIIFDTPRKDGGSVSFAAGE